MIVHQEICIAGTGGQGALLAGELIATTGMQHGLQVTCSPSYKPEVRGGESNCLVVISSEPIGSMTVGEPDVLILMSSIAAARILPTVKPDGIVLYNSTLVDGCIIPKNLRAVAIPATELAEKLGGLMFANMVLTGAYAETCNALTLDMMKKTLATMMTGRKEKFLSVNEAALEAGAKAAREVV